MSIYRYIMYCILNLLPTLMTFNERWTISYQVTVSWHWSYHHLFTRQFTRVFTPWSCSEECLPCVLLLPQSCGDVFDGCNRLLLWRSVDGPWQLPRTRLMTNPARAIYAEYCLELNLPAETELCVVCRLKYN